MHPQRLTELRKLRRRQRGEYGSALIPVLALIFSCSMIVSAVIALSQTGTYSIAAHVKLQKSVYICEGVMNRVQWLLTAETAQNGDTSFQDFDYSDSEYDRFLPDGVVHETDYHGSTVRFTITDASSGLDFSASGRNNTFAKLTSDDSETDYNESMEILQNRINDYVDSDDTAASDSMEADDYEAEGKNPLPRNAAFQYREELFYIPGFTGLFPADADGRLSQIRLFVPNTLAYKTIQQTQNGRTQSRRVSIFSSSPNIFNASDVYLKNTMLLDDSELEQVKEAIRNYQTDRTPFSESLESTLMLKLQNLSWTASGTYTIRIDASSGRAEPGRRLTATYTLPSDVAGPSDGVIRYLEWNFY